MYKSILVVQRMKNRNKTLLHWSLILQEYELEIQHVKGCNNVVADTLSRAM